MTSTPADSNAIANKLRDISHSRQLVVGILIFPNVEVLDFCGPFEVLSVCRLGGIDQDDNVTASPFSVKLIAKTMEPITTIGGMQVLPHETMEDIMMTKKTDTTTSTSFLDILIIPGGMGTRPLRHDTQVLDFIRHQAAHVSILASVCTGAILLAESGVLPLGTTITTHWQALDLLQEWYGAPNHHLIIDKEHSVTKNASGSLYTSAGISAGIDMCFRIIRDIFGDDVSRTTAKRMEYSYPEDYQRRIEF
jgi:transcriptional regulator GlxA family with amidase domain